MTRCLPANDTAAHHCPVNVDLAFCPSGAASDKSAQNPRAARALRAKDWVNLQKSKVETLWIQSIPEAKNGVDVQKSKVETLSFQSMPEAKDGANLQKSKV